MGKEKKEKEIDNQRLFEYCLYEMVSDLFKKSICLNERLEQRMLIYFKDSKLNDQVSMENLCEKIVNNKVLPLIPDEALESEAKIMFKKIADTDIYGLNIYFDNYCIVVYGVYKGSKTEVKVSRLVKK